jgi:asparagine synthase (glutamine-hydrolysing)
VCGICGFVAARADVPRDALLRQVSAMADELAYRGPDGAGGWADPQAGVALGHRRLSVIDLSPDGAQPMISSCGRYVLSYNGEIYNFRELRRELEAAGRRFRGTSDTEVLVEALGAWGVARALERIDGMFAFAAWDTVEHRLHLARDPIGKKPLYVAQRGGALWFGSELKALRAHPAFAATLDRDSLACFVRFSFIPAPHTIYDGVAKLQAGTHLEFDVGTGIEASRRNVFASVRAWAEAGECDPFRGNAAETIATLEELLRDAVARRTVADVPLGALLSGGIDSSLVVALLGDVDGRPPRTFSIGYRESDHDESGFARQVAAHLGTDHTELIVTPEQAREVIPRLPAMYDEPFADTSQIPTALVCALARRHVTVVLSGDGGDELFGGYPRYADSVRRARTASVLPSPIRRGLASAARALAPSRLERFSEALLAGGVDGQFLAACARHPAHAAVVHGASGARPGASAWPALRDPLARLTALDLTGRLPESILVKVDRASMAVGLEVRSPLLDAQIVRFATRIPPSLRFRSSQPKWLLRRVLARHVPPALFERPKRGFGVPIGEWLRGPLREWGESLLAPDRLRAQGFLDADLVQRYWGEHQRRAPDRRFLLWNLLVFEAWLEAGGSSARGGMVC